MRCPRASTRSWPACATRRSRRSRHGGADPSSDRPASSNGAASSYAALTTLQDALEESTSAQTSGEASRGKPRAFPMPRWTPSSAPIPLRSNKTAGAAPADLRHRKIDPRRRRAGGDAEMGTAELSHDGEQERQHDPDRPGEIGPAVRGVISTARPIWSRRFASCIRNCAMPATAASCSMPKLPFPRPRCATASRWR